MFTLKAESAENASNAILLPFHSRWEVSMASESIKAVFRRRGPQDWSPETIYAYFGKPVSAIRMRLKVGAYRWLTVDDAARMASSVIGRLKNSQCWALFSNHFPPREFFRPMALPPFPEGTWGEKTKYITPHSVAAQKAPMRGWILAPADNREPECPSEQFATTVRMPTELCVFEIESRDVPRTPLTMQTLREEFGYIPTPNYVRLSKHGVQHLDELLGSSRQ